VANVNFTNRTQKRSGNLGQIFDVVCVEQKLLQTACIALYVVWHSLKALVSLIHILYVTIATLPERHASQHRDQCTPQQPLLLLI